MSLLRPGDRRSIAVLLFVSIALVAHGTSAATLVDFEDTGDDLPIDGDFHYEGADGAGGFTSRGASFSNSFTDFGGGFTAWNGWAYSQVVDTVTPGFGNQFAAVTGSGVGSSPTYGVAFPGGESAGEISTIALPTPKPVAGAWITNTTYAALSMRDGDPFSDPFGGPGGDEPDWLLLTVFGYDALDQPTGSAPLYLADFRFADDSQDYILDEWTWLDLRGLGDVDRLDFVLTGSQVNAFGLETPAYFALDDLRIVPEPRSGALAAAGLLWLAARRRRAG